MLLTDVVAVISGADNAAGIGFGIARAYVAHGARVGLLGLGQSGLTKLADVLNDSAAAPVAIGVEADVTDRSRVDAAVAAVVEHLGPLTTVVANAGIVSSTALEDIAATDLRMMADVNIGGVVNLVQAALPYLRSGGSIISVGSIAALQGGGIRGGPHYAATKGGVLSLTRAIARQLGPRGIRANTIHPGIIRSPMTADTSPETESQQIQSIPLGRLGDPDDVAGAAVFFGSPLSRYVTGTDLSVNGGLYIG